MAEQDALRFLQSLRRDTTSLKRLQSTPPHELAWTLVQMGREAGDRFTLAELQAAFARDCAMRWLRYRQRADDGAGGRGGRSPSGPNSLL